MRGLAAASIAVLAMIGGARSASAQTYTLTWWTVDGGGASGTAGGTYTLSGTAGQPDAGAVQTGGTYTPSGGFWGGALSSAPQADLSMVQSDAPDPVVGLQSLTYTLTVANAGPAAASAVSVTDTLPVGVVFQSAGGTGWACGEGAGIL